MKKTLLAALLSCFVVLSLQADLIWYEPFNYVDGPIIATSTNLDGSTNWFRHSGTASPSDAVVANYKLQNSATGGTLSRQDDVNRKLAVTAGSPYTNGPQALYASFTVNCTNVPTAAGYFAHFWNGTTFYGRVYALAGSLPNTWRLGIAGLAGSASKVFPVDLAPKADYQVVVGWDPISLYAATLWVNPTSSGDVSVTSNDAVSSPVAVQAYAFRQGSGFGSAFFNITNLAVATTFEEAATNVWSAAPAVPAIIAQPVSITNFPNQSVSLSVVADGQGLGGLTYQWQKAGGNISNPAGNTNVLTLPSISLSDVGPYNVVVTAPNGLSVTSAPAYLAIDTRAIAPFFILQPANKTVYIGQTATFAAAANGPVPITYQWYYGGAPVSGATDTTLSVLNVRTNNGTTGTYVCYATNQYGWVSSSNAVLSAIAPPATNIGYLRTLVDPVFFLPTNTTALWTVTGIVTTYTNITTSANTSFYMQDATGGINVFFGGNTSVQPQAGDSVTVTGPLGQFNSLLEMNLTVADPSHSVVINSSGNLLPPGAVLPFYFTNTPSASNAIRFYQSAVVTFTNVFFPDGFTGTNVFASGGNYAMTNAGGSVALRVDTRVGDIIGRPIPAFAWTVTGPMSFFLGNTDTNRSGGFQLLPTRYADIVTNAPPAVTGIIALTGAKPVVSWMAQPFMSYSILRATNVAGPYTPLVTGLTFNTTAGRYTDTNTVPATRFYRVVSP